MEDVKKQGKTRFVGIATHSFEPEAIRAAADTGIYDLVMTAYNFKHPKLEDLEKALEELKKLDEMKDSFLSSVSHELRTPLTSIRS